MDSDEIKRRRLEELNKQLDSQIQEEIQIQQQVQQLESVVKQKMTKEALQRFGNIKIAHPEKALRLLVFLARGIQLGKLAEIDDKILKEILSSISEKREIRIKRR